SDVCSSDLACQHALARIGAELQLFARHLALAFDNRHARIIRLGRTAPRLVVLHSVSPDRTRTRRVATRPAGGSTIRYRDRDATRRAGVPPAAGSAAETSSSAASSF